MKGTWKQQALISQSLIGLTLGEVRGSVKVYLGFGGHPSEEPTSMKGNTKNNGLNVGLIFVIDWFMSIL